MFYKLITRNSARSRKENGLFFASLLVSIIAFYIILALPRQDVMIFLGKMESQAVDRLFQMIPLFFGMTSSFWSTMPDSSSWNGAGMNSAST